MINSDNEDPYSVECMRCRFIKEEPHRLDKSVVRCKQLSGTLSTLKKYVRSAVTLWPPLIGHCYSKYLSTSYHIVSLHTGSLVACTDFYNDKDSWRLYTVKNIRISADVLWQYFNETGSVYVVSVNRRNNEARASLFRRFMDTNVYGTGSINIWKTRHDIYGYFYSVWVMYLCTGWRWYKEAVVRRPTATSLRPNWNFAVQQPLETTSLATFNCGRCVHTATSGALYSCAFTVDDFLDRFETCYCT